MTYNELVTMIQYIVQQGMDAIHANMGEQKVMVDYCAIFARDDHEYGVIEGILEFLGKEIEKEKVETGRTFLLHKPIDTQAGTLFAIKIRKPDPTRPQRGAPDFRMDQYQELKEKFLSTSGNFTLMVRKDYEMIELKGVDVLVYIPNKTFIERMESY